MGAKVHLGWEGSVGADLRLVNEGVSSVRSGLTKAYRGPFEEAERTAVMGDLCALLDGSHLKA